MFQFQISNPERKFHEIAGILKSYEYVLLRGQMIQLDKYGNFPIKRNSNQWTGFRQ
jgi:hypothetical protein